MSRPESGSPIWCSSFDDYCRAAAAGAVPVLTSTAAYGETDADAGGGGQHHDAAQVDWQHWVRLVVDRGEPGVVGEVLTVPGPAAVCAAVLARALKSSLQVVERDVLEAATVRMQRSAWSGVVVLLPDDTTDAALMDLMSGIESLLASERPWRDMPSVSLLTARDLAALSAAIYKACDEVHDRFTSLLHLTPTGPTGRAVVLDEFGARQQDDLTGEQIVDNLRLASVVGYDTHGIESCASGGAGVVLCGLASGALELGPSVPGQLACGRGHACPRGPRPLPLRELGGVLLLASCNSLRFDGLLGNEFNLALNFADGPGQAFVGSVHSGHGGAQACRVFLAAMASNYSVQAATMLINALLVSAGLDRPMYLSVGLGGPPDGAADAPRSVNVLRSGDALLIDTDAGAARLIELEIADQQVIGRARRGLLALSITSESSDVAPEWLARVETRGGEDTLRLFVFGFPAALGRLHIQIEDRAVRVQRMRNALAGFETWPEVGRLASLRGESQFRLEGIQDAVKNAEHLAAQVASRLGFDGDAPVALTALAEVVESLDDQARRIILADLAPRLEGSFWLTHLFSEEYHRESGDDARCRLCGRTCRRRVLRHPWNRRAREADVCQRCGIVSDVSEAGALGRPTIEMDELVSPGSMISVRLKVQVPADAGGQELLGCVRISSTDRRPVKVAPELASCSGAPGEEVVMTFTVQVPRDMAPHQLLVKSLVAARGEIAFASFPFFVRAASTSAHGGKPVASSN